MFDQMFLDETQAIKENLAPIKNKILVMSGKGGVGKSTISANLAVYLASQKKAVSLFDIDFHGPSIPKMLKLEGNKLHGDADGRAFPIEWNAYLNVLSIGFLLEQPNHSVNWRGLKKHQVIRQFLKDTNWGNSEYMIIDTPPGTGDEHLSIFQSIEDLRGAIIVTTGQEVAISDVKKSIHFCRQVKIPILGIIENMSGLICNHCQDEIDLFGMGGGAKLAKEEDLPFLGRIPLDSEGMKEADKGEPLVLTKRNSKAKDLMIQAFNQVLLETNR